jgi:hypothetical protein
MDSRWVIKRTNSEYVHYLSRTASISPVLAQILINRGIKTADDIHDFLHPGLSSLSDPFELPDMKVAVERIKSALKRNERIHSVQIVTISFQTGLSTDTVLSLKELKKQRSLGPNS